jgi:hypothetical protein
MRKILATGALLVAACAAAVACECNLSQPNNHVVAYNSHHHHHHHNQYYASNYHYY